MTSSCVKVAGSLPAGAERLHVRNATGKLDMRADAAAVDGVVLPRAALLARARVVVEVELADQRAGGVEHVEEPDVRMPVAASLARIEMPYSVSATRNSPARTFPSGK